MRTLYDEKGREIHPKDLIKVFHFTGARRKKHYMYKQVSTRVMGLSGEQLYALHLPIEVGKQDPGGYYLQSGADENGRIEGTVVIECLCEHRITSRNIRSKL